MLLDCLDLRGLRPARFHLGEVLLELLDCLKTI